MSGDFFPAALAYLLHDEGGFVDNPADKGGPTKYGVTMATLARWRRGPVSAEDVRNLTPAEATQIYFHWYWKPLGCDRLSQPSIATMVLNAGALFGVGVSAVAAQKAARSAAGSSSLAVDGHVGPATVAALNSVDPRRFAAAFSEALLERAVRICEEDPRDDRFERDWLARIGAYTSINV